MNGFPLNKSENPHFSLIGTKHCFYNWAPVRVLVWAEGARGSQENTLNHQDHTPTARCSRVRCVGPGPQPVRATVATLEHVFHDWHQRFTSFLPIVCLYSSSLHLALRRHFCFSSVCLCFPLSFSVCPSGLPSWCLSCVCLYVCTPVCLYLHLSVFVHASLSLCECLPVHTFLRMKVPAQQFELTDFTNVNGTQFWATLSPVLSSQPQGLPRLQGQVEFFSMTHEALCNLSPSGGPAPYSASPHGWHNLA